MSLKILGAVLVGPLLYVFWKILHRYYNHYLKPWVGIGWVLTYDEKTKLVTVSTYLLESPVGRAGIKRGSILLSRNGQSVPQFDSKEAFSAWMKSRNPVLGKAVTYKLREPVGGDGWQEREVTLWYEKLRGAIPQYAPFPTWEQMHADWRRLMPKFKATYPTYRCPRTGVTYHRVRVTSVDEV